MQRREVKEEQRTIQNARRVALGICSGRIILNFGITERLRAFRYPIFIRENGPPERPQTLRGAEIIDILSAEIAQSEAERSQNGCALPGIPAHFQQLLCPLYLLCGGRYSVRQGVGDAQLLPLEQP